MAAKTEVGLRLDEDTVRGTRERLGLTLAMVAQRAGTSKNTVMSAEHGADIRPTTARKISGALGVEISDLLGESDSPKAEAPPSQQLTINGLLAEERRYRPTTQDVQALDRYLSRMQRELDEDRMRRHDVERELEVVRAFGPAVCASMGDETADLILVVGRRLLEKAKEMKVRVDVEAEAGVTRLEEWREREAS
jgi:transcriptional regulator with XRE-family HTH domain